MRTERGVATISEAFEAGSPQMQHAARLARLYSGVDRPVLLLGDVGVGKTTLARLIHTHSRREGSLVLISSGELTETLYSDTLFGHVEGAFTGASGAKRGCIECADRGTLLLDDVALMPIVAQAAILRVLESRRFRPLGATEDRVTSTRFIFASTYPLSDLVGEGRLLPDLESRIGELIIDVPALRDRREEITALAVHAGTSFLTEQGLQGTVEFTDECEDLLMRYPWPRNVRELRGVIERAVIHAGCSDGVVLLRPGHLPDRFHEPFDDSEWATPPLTRGLVENVLGEVAGNQSEAARRLGVHRNTIARYLRSVG
jgi:DNA-binding NtrC family response regulator